MEKMNVAQARKQETIGRQATLNGWVRTRRDYKGSFSFLELNDGSCLGNIQVIIDSGVENYETEIKHLAAGCSVTVEGEIKASGGAQQPTEVAARRVKVWVWSDPEQYPLQKKRHSFEK